MAAAPLSIPSFEEFGISDPNDPSLEVVRVDGLTILKIINHCRENLPEVVTGQLLGLDFGAELEVTNCFPFPSRSEEEDEPESGAEYQIEMLKCLREVNVDHYTVGWYQSAYLGSFLNDSLIETQYNYQQIIKKCVVVIFDPLKTAQGTLTLKAYRLTQSFMELFKTQPFTKESLNESNLSFNEIIEEIPVRIHNSLLVSALLEEFSLSSPLMQPDFESLNMGINPYLEKVVESLTEAVDDLAVEQNRFQYYQKALARQQLKKEGEGDQNMKPPQPPSRLESMLITNQINNYCEQINNFANRSFAKLYLLNELQKPVQ